jgi:response regulator RpfG family c-di-GMP phosphodiesterase
MSPESTADRDKAILVVDDEPLILMALRRELRAEFGNDYVLEAASNASEGLLVVEELVREGVKVVLVVSDWLMPGMRGDEFLLELRRRYPHIRTIMVTGEADERQVSRVREAGALDAFFYKPWNAIHFSATCRQLLEQATA